MSEEFITVAKTSEIPVGQFKLVEINSQRLLVCHTAEGFYAVEDTCSHDKGTLADGFLEDNAIECPRHGARFDVTTGKVLCLPAPTAITAYPVKVDGDKITVKVS